MSIPSNFLNAQNPPRIVAAALRDPNSKLLISGARHYDTIMQGVLLSIYGNDLHSYPKFDDGFIDQYGKFYNRVEAWDIAAAQGQIRYRVGGDTTNGGTLYSENLY